MQSFAGLPLNLILLTLILILGMGNFRLAFSWAIGLGVLLDIYSFSSFNIFLVSLVATIILANLLQNNFFTDRSLYSFLALTFFSTCFYEILLLVLSYLNSFFARQEFAMFWTADFWQNEISKIIVNLLAITIFYYFINLVSKNLKPVFLKHNRSTD